MSTGWFILFAVVIRFLRSIQKFVQPSLLQPFAVVVCNRRLLVTSHLVCYQLQMIKMSTLLYFSRSISASATMTRPTNTCATCTRDSATRPITAGDECPSICTICLEPLTTTASHNTHKPTTFSEPAVAITTCGHIFGRNCLTQWMRESNTCPMCRVEFFKMTRPTAEEGNETPFFALGVYAGAGMMEHFSGLAISLRDEDETGFGADERHRVSADLGGGGGRDERVREVGKSGGRRVWHA